MLFIILTLITATAIFLGVGQASLSTAVNLARDDVRSPTLGAAQTMLADPSANKSPNRRTRT